MRNLPPSGVLPKGGTLRGRNLATGAAAAALAVGAYAIGVSQNAAPATAQNGTQINLWKTYTDVLAKARYIDLTHTITPNMPVWKGFGPAKFSPTRQPGDGSAVHVRQGRVRGDALRHRRRTSSGRSSTRRRTGRPSTRRSTSCRRRSRCGRWS